MSAFNSDCLKGRCILITGGCGAIGRVVVASLAAHGASVAVNDVVEDAEARDILPSISDVAYFKADTTDEGAVGRLFDEVQARFGIPHAVLCHAGMVEIFPIVEYPLDRWKKLIDLNLNASFLVAREAARRLRPVATMQHKRRIILTSSWVQDVPWPEISAYNASKGALNMLMRTMARELAPAHILVNGLAPGIVAVGLAKRYWDTDSTYRARAEKAIPLGYMQPPDSIADAFVYLCSDASRYMTGATLLVDGGCSLYPMF